jgi:nucleoside-diphosphate-sugar epimerase
MAATLVTGAGGFLGRHVAEALLAKGQPVRAMVRRAEQADDLRSRGAEVVVGDVRDPDAVAAAVRDTPVVHHCAAVVGPLYSKEEIYAVNLEGVRHVLEALRQQGKGRMVLVSSVNVLGIRNLHQANEDFPCRRANEPHADVKIAAEQLALDYHRRHRVEVAIVRPALIYGPGEKNIPRLLDAIRRGKFSYIGSRENIIPMVHVDDVVQAMMLAAASPAAAGRIYHITDGQQTTIRQFIEYLAELIHCPAPVKKLPYAVPAAVCLLFEWLHRLHLVRGHGPINRVGLRFLGTSRSVDISRAVQELGYQPRVSFRAGMAATVAWIEQHQQSTSDAGKRSD